MSWNKKQIKITEPKKINGAWGIKIKEGFEVGDIVLVVTKSGKVFFKEIHCLSGIATETNIGQIEMTIEFKGKKITKTVYSAEFIKNYIGGTKHGAVVTGISKTWIG